ncbi:MAG: serine protein kinase PrkA [bacterium]|nr:serine protein kinase PrkA [bacterium]
MPAKNKITNILHMLNEKLQNEDRKDVISFEELLNKVSTNPTLHLRNIFQLFYNMIHYYIPEGVNIYPNDPESINYIDYNYTNLFVKNTNSPFFADKLLINRLINDVNSFKKGVLAHKMLVFIGPHGSGKSTFLTNLLHKLELYTKLPEGVMYDTLWELDINKIGTPMLLEVLQNIKSTSNNTNEKGQINIDNQLNQSFDKYLHIPCPNHDHPIIQIPLETRMEMLDKIIDNKDLKKLLFYGKEYEWLRKKTPCAICSSIYKSLSKKLPFEEILSMIHGKIYEFDRKMGEGISVYNPSDFIDRNPIRNKELQKWIDTLFKSSDTVSYVYSKYAKTNNGVYAIMDAKSNNIDRFKNIHSIISDGTHKVDTFEENIDSLFIALVNPEDMDVIAEEKSFLDRIKQVPVPYIRDYHTEVEIYKNIYSEQIENYFMPHVLRAFAKTIISSRLNVESEAIKKWIKNKNLYSSFIDKDYLLLKMEIFTGNIPNWLSEIDTKRFNRDIRRTLIMEGDIEGCKGFSGRQSLDMINQFISKYKRKNKLITIDNIIEFFKEKSFADKLPALFTESLKNWYDYTVLQEVKESMFFYNENRISKNIKNYLYAISNEPGAKVKSPYTKEIIEITEEYLKSFERFILGATPDASTTKQFRDETLRTFVSKTTQQENSGKDLTDTEQYKDLFSRFHSSLKKDVMTPYISNPNFRRAIKDYNTTAFKNHDKRIKTEVKQLVKNLIFKFNYTEDGAKQTSIYVLDNKISEKFPG